MSGYRAGNTTPFLVQSRPTGPTSGTTGYPGNPDTRRYSPIVRAAPINGTNQPGSPAVGYGDLGGPNLAGQTPRISAAEDRLVGAPAVDHRSSVSSMSSVPSAGRLNASVSLRPDPAAQTTRSPVPLTTASHQQASSSSSSSKVNGAQRPPALRFNAHSSLV